MELHATSRRGIFSVADGITRIFLVGLAAILPFFIIPLPYAAVAQSKVLFIAAVVIIAIIVWVYARLTEGIVHVPQSSLVYVSMLLPIAYLISTLATGWNTASLVGQGTEQDTLAAVALMSSLFVLTAFAFVGNNAAMRLVVQGLVLGLIGLFALEALYVFFPQWFSLGGALVGQTANPFGSWHDLGIIAGLSFFISVMLWRADYFTGWKRYIPIALSLCAAFFLIVIHFNDVLWATAILFGITVAAVARTSLSHDGLTPVQTLRRVAVPFALAVVLAGAAFFGTKIWDKLPAPIQIVQTEVRPSWQGTFDVAKQSLQAPGEFIFGSGPNSFIREWGLHKPTSVNATPFWDSDFNYGVGIIPTSIFTAGAIGLIAWAALILVMLGLVWRFVRESRPLSHGRALFGVTLVSIAYLVAYYMIYTPGTALTAATFIGLGFLAVLATGDAPLRVVRIGVSNIGDGIRMLILVVIVLAAIAAAGIVGREVLSNIFVNKAAYIYQNSNDVAQSGNVLGVALLISPRNDRAHRAAAELGIVELAKQIKETDPNNQAAAQKLKVTLQDTIQHGLTAVSIDGTNYQNWLLLAQVYSNLAGANIAGAYDQAKTAYEKAFAAHPTNPVPKFRLAQLAVAAGDRASARTYLQDALKLKPDFAAAQFLLSQVEAADGKGDAAVTAATAAVQQVPQDPLGWFNLGYILYAGQSYQNAAQALAQAVQLAPDYSNALFYLGLSLYHVGDKADAVIALDRVVQLNPGEAWVAQVSANIKAGKDPMAGVQQK